MSGAQTPLEYELFDEFINILSDRNVWKNIYRPVHGYRIIYHHFVHIKDYINMQNKAKQIMDAIAKNEKIEQVLKGELIDYMIERGMKYNKYETLFENASQIIDCTPEEMYDRLAPYITNKLIGANFQTNIGNIFHCLLYTSPSPRD